MTFFTSVLKDPELILFCTPAQWRVQDLIRTDLRSTCPILTTLSAGNQTMKKASHTRNIPASSTRTSSNCAKRSKCAARKALHKYSSNIEVTAIFPVALTVRKTLMRRLYYNDICRIKLCRNPHNPGPTLIARNVAKAMAHQGPPGETILQKSALLQVKKKQIANENLSSQLLYSHISNFFFLQEELNSSDCGWALLVTETDPHVLSCLLWTWLDKLRVSCVQQDDIMPVLPFCLWVGW